MKNTEMKIREILGNVLQADIEKINIDDELVEWGINSSGILKIIVAIEKEFLIRFDDEDFDSKNFRSISSLVQYVENKSQKV